MPQELHFKVGRYYLRNGFKAVVIDVDATKLFGKVLIPDNIWVPTYWNRYTGASEDSNFDLSLCIEELEDEQIKWEAECHG